MTNCIQVLSRCKPLCEPSGELDEIEDGIEDDDDNCSTLPTPIAVFDVDETRYRGVTYACTITNYADFPSAGSMDISEGSASMTSDSTFDWTMPDNVDNAQVSVQYTIAQCVSEVGYLTTDIIFETCDDLPTPIVVFDVDETRYSGFTYGCTITNHNEFPSEASLYLSEGSVLMTSDSTFDWTMPDNVDNAQISVQYNYAECVSEVVYLTTDIIFETCDDLPNPIVVFDVNETRYEGFTYGCTITNHNEFPSEGTMYIHAGVFQGSTTMTSDSTFDWTMPYGEDNAHISVQYGDAECVSDVVYLTTPIYEPVNVCEIWFADGSSEVVVNNHPFSIFKWFYERSDIVKAHLIKIGNRVTDMRYAWGWCTSMDTFICSADTSSVTNMYYTWAHCTSLTSFPEIDTSRVTDMRYSWRYCSSLTSFPEIDTSSVTNMYYTWERCSSLTEFPLIDTSRVSNMFSTWYGCKSLTSFPEIDTSSVSDMVRTWSACTSLTSFPAIDTSSATNMETAWSACTSLTSFPEIDISSVTNMERTWYNCNSLTSFPAIDTSNITNMYMTWSYCSSLTSFPLIDTSSVTNMYMTWDGCSSLTSFPAIDTSSVTDMSLTWRECTSLISFPAINTGSVTNMGGTWRECTSLISFPAINTGSVTNMFSTWYHCYSLTSFGGVSNCSASTIYTWSGTALDPKPCGW